MTKIISFFLLFFCAYGICNAQKKYIFNVELSHYNNAPTFTMYNGLLEYTGLNQSEMDFFSSYEILDFYQTYPSSNRLVNLNMFTFITFNEKLMDDLLINFPNKFIRIENLTDLDAELTNYYPNDYGISNPNISGYFANQKHLDYMNAAKAWEILGNGGSQNIKIGISDARIEINDIDFSNKITWSNNFFTNYTNWSNPSLATNVHYFHGTCSAGYAAGNGNNNHGGTGVCYDCSIYAEWYNPSDYNHLLYMAQAGAKVINMSWANYSSSPTYIESQQNIINEIYEDYNVTLVASSGNLNPLRKSPQGNSNGTYDFPNGNLWGFPASYDNVISVMSVNHYADLYELYGVDSWEPNPNYAIFPMSYYVKDMISPRVIPNYNNTGVNLAMTDRVDDTHTHNDKVDICAPAWNVMRYDKYLSGQNVSGGGTSTSAPLVSGTFGLMYSANSCLLNSEAEDVLKLTAKNIENMNGNQPFYGRIGAGKAETGDAVEFVNEMKKIDGNALIDGQDFWRFTFDLQHINNKLTISNQTFRDQNVSNFIAKNEIRLLPGTSIKPNSLGSFHLGINPNINVSCSPIGRNTQIKETENKQNETNKETILYPNPNTGNFNLDNIDFELFSSEIVNVKILDLNGRILFENKINKKDINSYQFSMENKLSTGIYLLNLSSERHNKSIKFIIK